jgi:hypothetical protein
MADNNILYHTASVPKEEISNNMRNMPNILKDVDILQSMRPSEYILDRNRVYNEKVCRPQFGILGGTAVSHTNSNIVDVENELYGLTRSLSKCSSFKYMPPTEENIDKYVQKNYNRPNKNPVLNLNKKHLETCDFFDYNEIEKEPPMIFDVKPLFNM